MPDQAGHTPRTQDPRTVARPMRPYVAPSLRVYGDLRRLTRGGMGATSDMGVKPTHV
jgi:hypothetical protein